ncbi:MAG TPA: protein kinase [Pyrinomonadaceae bacterium]
MTPERWRQVEEIFQTALDLAPGERAPFLEEACGGDAELRRDVEAMLAQYEEAGDFLDEPLVEQSGLQELAALMGEAERADPLLGQRVGAYRIEREIGRGGMGVVYLAQRADGAFRMRAAVKVIKRGMDTDFVLRRFRHERRILASLQHYNIARLFDAGATEAGLPYFVMEYIEGEPLYDYCDARQLPLRERLRLFAEVCDAVHYAHQKQVVHRDIKPPNILVNPSGVPKLFDFGIAKLLNPELTPDTAPQTLTAMRLMTVEYASPEQVQGLPVTSLSDVYSLGVLLYELLTGRRPYRFRSRLPHDVALAISEQEPERPSTAVTRTDNLTPAHHASHQPLTAELLAELRGAAPDELRLLLAGALDNVELKALRKDPAERYQSAAALREDINNYLEGRPVNAPAYLPPAPVFFAPAPAIVTPPAVRPIGASPKSVAVLPLKLLDTGTGGTDTDDSYLGVGLADTLITRLSNVRRFVVRPTASVLRFADQQDPFAAGRELAARYVLDGYIRRAGGRLRVTLQLLDVEHEAAVWAEQFGSDDGDVLELEDSIAERVARALVPQLSGEEQRQISKRGTDDPEAYEVYLRGRFHWSLMTEEGFAKAIGYYERAVELDPSYALAYTAIVEYYIFLGVQCVLPFAECARRATAAAERAAALDPSLAEARAALGVVAINQEFDWAKAERYASRAAEMNPNSFMANQWLKTLYLQTGRFDEALKQARRLLDIAPDSMMSLHFLAWTHHCSRRLEDSISAHRQLIRDAPHYAFGRLSFSWTLRCAGEFEEAVAQARKGVELAPASPLYLSGLAAAEAGAGRLLESRRALGEIVEMSAARYVPPYMLAIVYLALGERSRALDQLERAFAIRDVWVVWLGVEPQFDPLRSDARFADLLRRMNHPLAPK